jgi:hypothetical protein
MHSMRRFLLACLCFAYAAPAQVWPPKRLERTRLVTDRPDYTESPETVRLGEFQWEAGFSREAAGTARRTRYGAPLMRLGLGSKVEMRVSGEGYATRVSVRDRLRGLTDPALGFKWKLWDETRWRPAIAVIPALSLPAGNSRLAGAYDPSNKVAWAKELGTWSLGGNINWLAFTDARGRLHQHAVSFSAGRDIGYGLTGYVEVYRFSRETRSGANVAIFQSGVTIATGADSQWDLSAGRRMTRLGPDWMFATGFAFRHRFARTE